MAQLFQVSIHVHYILAIHCNGGQETVTIYCTMPKYRSPKITKLDHYFWISIAAKKGFAFLKR